MNREIEFRGKAGFNATFGHCPDCGMQVKHGMVENGSECLRCHKHNMISHYPVPGEEYSETEK